MAGSSPVWSTMIEPLDIVQRLCRSKPFWFDGPPKISLTGKSRKFGKLQFEFSDEIIQYKIWIKDRQHILEVATDAVDNFTKYAKMLKH